MNGVLAFAGNVIVEGDPWQILGGSAGRLFPSTSARLLASESLQHCGLFDENALQRRLDLASVGSPGDVFIDGR
jgi:hypothetical protein